MWGGLVFRSLALLNNMVKYCKAWTVYPTGLQVDSLYKYAAAFEPIGVDDVSHLLIWITSVVLTYRDAKSTV